MKPLTNKHVDWKARKVEELKTKKYPDGSTGGYICPCRCGKPFIGHKRDSICPECEIRRSQMSQEEIENEAMRGMIRALVEIIENPDKDPFYKSLVLGESRKWIL